jgi:hypothetical protein
MKKVSICLVLNNRDYWGTIYSFESTGFAIVEKKGEIIIKNAPIEYIKVIDNVEVELLIGYTDTIDKRLLEYFKPIATNIIEIKHKDGVVGAVSDAQSYNELFKLAQNEYICILKPYVTLQKHWLIELIHYYTTIDKSGIIGICPKFSNVNLVPLPSNQLETLTSVIVPQDNLVNCNGVMFFLREYLYFVGALDESCLFVGGAEFMQLQKRFFALGYNNYYIPTQSCIISKERKITDYMGYEATKENLNNTLLSMKKAKTYYIPL